MTKQGIDQVVQLEIWGAISSSDFRGKAQGAWVEMRDVLPTSISTATSRRAGTLFYEEKYY